MNRESPSSVRRRRVASFTAALAVTLLLMIIGMYTEFGFVQLNTFLSQLRSTTTAKNNILSLPLSHRKLLTHGEKLGKGKGGENGDEKAVEPNRIWSEKCSKFDIVISQGATEPLPNGIPTYTVEIMNTCTSGCDIGAIHLSCGWFSSARLVNPRVFKRLRFDDCLVNDGKPLVNGRTLSFQYANTFRYPLAVSSVRC